MSPETEVVPPALDAALRGVQGRMVAVRRDIHAHPELAWHEVRTSAVVAAELSGAGLEPKALPAATGTGTGLTCDVVGDPGGPLVVLRADLDALPLSDATRTAHRSTVPGTAHACGHDVHTSVVLGAGLALSRLATTGSLPGRVRLLFQPAEEVQPGGALAALEAGVLDGAGRAFALHCDPRVDAGQVALRPGAMTAAADVVTVRVSGPGGHTARPQLTVDVVAALADLVARSPAVLSRRVDPRAALSLVWGKVVAGTAANVIPQRGEAAGTIRVLDRSVWDELSELVPALLCQILAPYRAEVDVDYVRGVPPAVNDPEATEEFRLAAEGALGAGAVQATEPSMGGEDFGWILARVPGVLCRLGVHPPGAKDAPDLHRGDFDVDETAIGCGSRVLAVAALDAVRRLASV